MESCDSEEAEKELRVELILLGEFSRLLINPMLIDSQMVHIDHIEANSKAFPKSLSLFVPSPRKGKKPFPETKIFTVSIFIMHTYMPQVGVCLCLGMTIMSEDWVSMGVQI